jgi:hypothetical protein
MTGPFPRIRIRRRETKIRASHRCRSRACTCSQTADLGRSRRAEEKGLRREGRAEKKECSFYLAFLASIKLS